MRLLDCDVTLITSWFNFFFKLNMMKAKMFDDCFLLSPPQTYSLDYKKKKKTKCIVLVYGAATMQL